MKEETKQLLFVKGQARLAEHLTNLIDGGNTELEDAIVASNKSLDDCWKYITYKARKLAVDGCACIEDEVVYQWAMKFYAEKGEPDDMEKPAPKPAATTTEKGKKKRGKKTEEAAAVSEETVASEEAKSEDAQVDSAEAVAKDAMPAETEAIKEPEQTTVEEAPDASEEIAGEQMEIAPADENVPGEELRCAICGKKMKDAYAGRQIESIRKWTQGWLDKYGAVFCCKEHMEQYVREHSEVK